MIKLTEDEIKLVVTIGRQYPKFIEVLNNWRTKELESLVFATKDTSDVIRGRVQVLTEMQQAFKTRV